MTDLLTATFVKRATRAIILTQKHHYPGEFHALMNQIKELQLSTKIAETQIEKMNT